MVPRAHWKGFLKLSLVSCPVALYPAVAASERVSFRHGFIEYNGHLEVHSSLLSVVLAEQTRSVDHRSDCLVLTMPKRDRAPHCIRHDLAPTT